MIASARHWRAFADRRVIAAEQRRRRPGSDPIRGQMICPCGEPLGACTAMCGPCYRVGWEWTALAFRDALGVS